MIGLSPLFAVDFGSLATVIITVVGLIIYAVNQVLEVQRMNPPAGPQRGPTGRTLDPFANPNAPPQPNAPPRRPEEVDSYLRDVTARQNGQNRRRNQQQRPDQRQRPAPANSGNASLAPVGSLAQQHSIEDHAKQFSQRVVSDVARESEPSVTKHLQSAFSNSVGTLAAGSESEAAMASGHATRDTASPFAAELRVLLSNPKSLQQAIILQEILQPPTHRW